MIVTYRHRRSKPSKPKPSAQPSRITAPIVIARHPKQRRYDRTTELPDDAEADARVAEFFARMIRPR